MTSEGPKSPALPPLPTVRHVATIFTAPRSARSCAPRHPRGNHVGAGDRELRRAVAAAEDAEALPGLPEARADDDDDRRRRRCRARAPRARACTTRVRAKRAGGRLHPAERREERARDDRHERPPAARRAAGAPGRTGSSARARRACDSPKNAMNTEYATTLARTLGTSASASKSSRWRTSTARSAAPSGVRKTAAMPAAVPATRRMRRSRSVTRRQLPDERADGAAHLHRRALAPAGAARAEGERSDTRRLHERRRACGRRRCCWWKASMMASLPPPRVSGASHVEISAGEERPDRGDEQSSQGGTAARSPSRRGCARRSRAAGRTRSSASRHDALHGLDAGEEERPEQPRGGADERGVEQDAAEDLELDGRAAWRRAAGLSARSRRSAGARQPVRSSVFLHRRTMIALPG